MSYIGIIPFYISNDKNKGKINDKKLYLLNIKFLIKNSKYYKIIKKETDRTYEHELKQYLCKEYKFNKKYIKKCKLIKKNKNIQIYLVLIKNFSKIVNGINSLVISNNMNTYSWKNYYLLYYFKENNILSKLSIGINYNKNFLENNFITNEKINNIKLLEKINYLEIFNSILKLIKKIKK